MQWNEQFLQLYDKTPVIQFDSHYLYHTAWAARILAKINPKHHIDISSDLHFVTTVSAFIPVEFYEYRPIKINLANFTSKTADLTKLPFESNSIPSISCMHVVEHIGLGRYGDPLNYDGDLTAMTELKRVLGKQGNLLFAVPIGGKARIAFNAHRIYTYTQILSYFEGLKLIEFALIPDNPKDLDKGIIPNASEIVTNRQRYGCGCFWFRKE